MADRTMVAERRRYTKPQQRAYRRRLRDRESVRLWGAKDVRRIDTPQQAQALPVCTWVYDRHGDQWCLVDTHVGWPQRMFMRGGATAFVSIEWMAYPLAEAELHGDCSHQWGAQECGHCRSCGQIVAEPKNQVWSGTVFHMPHETEQEAGRG
ncbi:hypothetical protein PV646_28555 [Streptomyces sp. ID05-26A]|nr:hypothetical protein [Streptomyces sp. ID05-26A]